MNRLFGRKNGFTLLELLIALSIISIISALAYGAFPAIEKYRTKDCARSVINAVVYSRSRAISDGQSIFLCPSKNGLTCDKNWSQKLLVYKNNDADPSFSVGDETLRIFDRFNSESLIRWGSFKNKHYLELLPTGMTNYQNGSFTVCPSSKNPEHAIPVIINVAGRAYFGKDKNKNGIKENGSGFDITCS